METTKAKIVNRAATPTRSAAAPVHEASRAAAAATAVSIQRAAMTVSSPHDPEEREAEATAGAVMRMRSGVADAPSPPRLGDSTIRRVAADGGTVASGGDGGETASADVAAEIEAAGSGAPFDAEVLDHMGPRFGADFTGVGVHTDARAARLSEQLGARAFTVGDQVFFGPGQFQPRTDAGKHLIAHELTHTLQQRGGARRQVWREPKAKPTAPKPTLPKEPVGKLATGRLDPKEKTITFDKLPIPGFKMGAHRGSLYTAAKLRRPKGATVNRDETAQRSNWEDDLHVTVRARIDALATPHKKGQGKDAGIPLVYEIAAAGDSSGYRYFFGSPGAIARRLTRPDWYLVGGVAHDRAYQVDHIVEWQLGGRDTPANYELLEARTNGNSGNAIKNSIHDRIDDFVKATGRAHGYDRESVKTGFDLVFQAASGTLTPKNIAANLFWTRDEIRALEHLKGIKVVEPTEIGGKTFVRLFGSAGGGSSRKYDWTAANERAGEERATRGEERSWLSPWVITHKLFRTAGSSRAGSGDLPADFGMLRVHLPAGHPTFDPVPPRDITLERAVEGAPRAGRLKPSRIALGLQAKYFSPIELPELEADAVMGLVGEGRIKPNMSLLRGLDLGIRMRGGDVRIFAGFDAGRFASNLPAPLRLTEGAIEVSYSSKQGWGVEGRLGLAIDRVGSGTLTASMSQRGFKLAGTFVFDTTLFDPAIVSFAYEQGKWSADGTIGLPKNRIPGVKGGNIAVRFANDQFTVLGNLDVDVPKLATGQLQVSYDTAKGLAIVGENIQLAVSIPRVREARGRFSLQQRQDGPGWKLGAALRAKIAIPGFESFELIGAYDDGFYDAAIDTTIVRGSATIRAKVGFTNRPVGEDGRAVDGPPLAQPVFFGSGFATILLGNWLRGTAAIEVTRDGVIKVEGRLDVPQDLVVIPDSATPGLDKEMLPFKGVSLHLFGIPGLVSLTATLNGGLRAKANIGAGVLRNAFLSVAYTVGDEDSLRVTGGFLFFMPASAGIEGHIAVGLRARVLVFVLGGEIRLTVGGGIRADIQIPVNGSWDRKRGLAIDTMLMVNGRPFVFVDVGGRIYFDLDLWLKSWTLHEKPFNLFHKELGSDMALRVTVPVKWSQEKGLDFSWSNVDIGFPSKEQAKTAVSGFASGLVGPEVQEADRRR